MKKLATIIIVLLAAVLAVFLFTKLVLPLLLGILGCVGILLKTIILCIFIFFVLLFCWVFLLKRLNREEALEKK